MQKPSEVAALPGDGDEIILKGTKDEDIFDTVIGHIEEIIIGPQFLQMKEDFLDRHYKIFEDCDENKHEYMSIFTQYTGLVENHIEKELIKRISGFSMKEFLDQISKRHNEDLLDGEIFDILFSFTDFLAFKAMMLDHKAAKEGKTPNLFLGNST